MAQYAMYAYCFFAILSLVNTVCGSLGVAVNIPSILLTIKQWVLMLAAIALWGIFRLIQPRNEKLLRRCCEVMVFYYVFSFVLSICFKFNLIPITQNGLITRTATILTWTKKQHRLALCHRIPDCRLPFRKKTYRKHAPTGHSTYPGFHRMADMCKHPPNHYILSIGNQSSYSLHLCQYVLCFFQHTRLYLRIL